MGQNASRNARRLEWFHGICSHCLIATGGRRAPNATCITLLRTPPARFDTVVRPRLARDFGTPTWHLGLTHAACGVCRAAFVAFNEGWRAKPNDPRCSLDVWSVSVSSRHSPNRLSQSPSLPERQADNALTPLWPEPRRALSAPIPCRAKSVASFSRAPEQPSMRLAIGVELANDCNDRDLEPHFLCAEYV